jgi:hypothetical protein
MTAFRFCGGGGQSTGGSSKEGLMEFTEYSTEYCLNHGVEQMFITIISGNFQMKYCLACLERLVKEKLGGEQKVGGDY